MPNLNEHLEHLETVQRILEGLLELDQGQGRPATDALKE